MGSRALFWLALALLCALGVWQRAQPAAEVVLRDDGGVHLLGTDAYYHMRHSRFVLEHFPVIQRMDVGTHYPDGRRAVAGLHDVLIGGATRAIYGSQATDAQLLRVAAWSPVAVAALALCLLALSVARFAHPAAGILAVALALLYPGELLARSVLGFADHHALEALLWIATVLGLVHALQHGRAARVTGLRGAIPALIGALPLVVFLFSWHGAPLHVGMLSVALGSVFLVALVQRRGEDWLGLALARYGLSAAVLALLLSWLWPWLVIDVLALRLSLGALAALGIGALLLARVLGPRPRALRLGAAVAAPALVAAAGMVLRDSHEQFRWALSTVVGVKASTITEHAGGGWSAELARHGPMLPAFALSLPGLLVHAWRRRDGDWVLASVVLACLLFYLLTRWVHDYGYVVPLMMGLVVAVAAGVSWPRAAQRRLSLGAVALVAFVAPVWPLSWVAPPWLERDALEQIRKVNDGWHQAGAWIASRTPAPATPIDARLDVVRDGATNWGGLREATRAGYAVASAWDDGHLVSALGRRAVVWSQYPRPALARIWLDADERAAHAALRALGDVRYAISEPRTPTERFIAKVRQAGGPIAPFLARARIQDVGEVIDATTFGKRHDNTLVSRLYQRSGMGLAHFRLVYESLHESFLQYFTQRPDPGGSWGVQGVVRPLDDAAARARLSPLVGRSGRFEDGYSLAAWIEPSVKVFELVEGAVVVGRAPPGARVVLDLQLQSNVEGRRHRYVRAGEADGRGRFAIRVAHGTRDDTTPGEHPSALRAQGPYRVSLERDGELVPLSTVHVPQSSVHAGDEVALPPQLPVETPPLRGSAAAAEPAAASATDAQD